MTAQEMRELDAWIAEHGFGWRIVHKVIINGETHEAKCGFWWPPDFGDPENPSPGATFMVSPPACTFTPLDFARIKREIERRGWIWQAAYCLEDGYDFAIFDPAGSVIHSLDDEETEVARILAIKRAETEELAGCLAFKAAVEGTDGAS